MSHEQNPPAFPTEVYYNERRVGIEEGMKLRDFFAAKAMQAYVEGSIARGLQWSPIGIAKEAYLLADAMRVERAK